jgi:tight adherence protein B
MSQMLPYQLAAGCFLLILLCMSALVLMHAQQRRRRLEARVAQQASSYGRAIVAASRNNVRSAASARGQRTILRFGAWLVGFNTSQPEHYHVAWWIVLPVGLVLARGIVALAQILIGWMALLLLPVIWLIIVRRFYTWCDQRRLKILYVQFPDVLAMLVRAVRVGIPIGEGIRSAARESPNPTGQEFRIVVDQLGIGVTLAEALYELAERNPLPEYRFFATALALQSETGGALSETLERLADVIRKRVALRSHARALASEARTSIYILACLPVFSGAALALLNPDYLATLFLDRDGQRVLAIALISLSTGIAAMRTIVNRSLS